MNKDQNFKLNNSGRVRGENGLEELILVMSSRYLMITEKRLPSMPSPHMQQRRAPADVM